MGDGTSCRAATPDLHPMKARGVSWGTMTPTFSSWLAEGGALSLGLTAAKQRMYSLGYHAAPRRTHFNKEPFTVCGSRRKSGSSLDLKRGIKIEEEE